jgi:hypothetical protein
MRKRRCGKIPSVQVYSLWVRAARHGGVRCLGIRAEGPSATHGDVVEVRRSREGDGRAGAGEGREQRNLGGIGERRAERGRRPGRVDGATGQSLRARDTAGCRGRISPGEL